METKVKSRFWLKNFKIMSFICIAFISGYLFVWPFIFGVKCYGGYVNSYKEMLDLKYLVFKMVLFDGRDEFRQFMQIPVDGEAAYDKDFSKLQILSRVGDKKFLVLPRSVEINKETFWLELQGALAYNNCSLSNIDCKEVENVPFKTWGPRYFPETIVYLTN